MKIYLNYICIFNIDNILSIFNKCMNLLVYNVLTDKLNVMISLIVKIEEFNIILSKTRISLIILVIL